MEQGGHSRLTVLAAVLLATAFSAGLLLSSEPIVVHLLGTMGQSLDIRFWSMGISAAGIMMAAWSFGALILRTSFLKDSHYRIQLVAASATYMAFFLVAEKRPFDTPCWDDFNALLEWFVTYKSSSGLQTKISLVAASYWECKTIVSRLTAVIVEFLSGEHFIHALKYVNGLLLIATAFLFSINFKQTIARTTVFVSSVLLLFNFQHFHTALCAFSGTTYYLTAIFALIAFIGQQSEKRYAFTVSLAGGVLAAWTFGNGWLVLPLLLLYNLRIRSVKRSLVVMAVTLLNSAIYFIGYEPQRLNEIDTFSLKGFIDFTMVFLGNSFQFLYFPYLPLLAAVFILSLTLLFTIRIIRRNGIPGPLWMMSVFLVGTAVMAAAFRHQAGVYYAYSVRYGYFSLLAFWAVLLLVFQENGGAALVKHQGKIILFAALFTLSKAVFFYPEMAFAQECYREVLIDWKRYNKKVAENTPFYPRGIEKILDDSEGLGTWKLLRKDTMIPNNSMFTIRYVDESNRWKEK